MKFLEFYYSLLGQSSVWSESSRTKKFEYESSIEYSQGPGEESLALEREEMLGAQQKINLQA